MRRRLLVALPCLAMITGCGQLGAADALESVGAEDGSGELCIPVSDDGLASFAWEMVANTSANDVTIRDIDAVTDEVDVVEWFLTREDWPDAGVQSGPLPTPGMFEEATTIPAHHSALVAVTMQANDLEEPLQTNVTVTYASERETGSLPLAWSVRLIPTGTSCSDFR